MILHLNDFGVRRARRTLPELGRKPLARGMFAAVFEGSTTDRVLKLTVDSTHYGYLTDYCAPQGVHKPVVYEDHGVVGELSTGQDLYLVEVERLQPLPRASEAYRVLRRLVNFVQRDRHGLMPEEPDAVKGYWPSLVSFMTQLNWFASNYECRIDAKVGQNYLQRPSDGAVVASDPVYDLKLMRTYRKPAYL